MGGLGKRGGRGDVVFQVVVEVKEKVVGLGKEGGVDDVFFYLDKKLIINF